MSSRCKWCGEPKVSPHAWKCGSNLVRQSGRCKRLVDPERRPAIRKVSEEARKIPESEKPKTPKVAPVLVDADQVVRVALELEGGGYVVVNSDEVVRVALELYKPMAIVRMAVLAVAPKDMSHALDELRQAGKWLEQMIEEVRDGAM